MSVLAMMFILIAIACVIAGSWITSPSVGGTPLYVLAIVAALAAIVAEISDRKQ